MKKYLAAFVLAAVLTGCAASQETFETIRDVYDIPAAAPYVRETVIDLPYDAVMLTMGSESAGKIYLCDDYSFAVQTVSAGDLDGTIRDISGYAPDALTVMETQRENCARYDFVWTSAGENGDQIGRGVVLDDGNYHYCLSAIADAAQSEAVSGDWERLFGSFMLT